MSESSDLELVRRWLTGEDTAAEKLHGRYLDRLLRLVRRNVADRFGGKFDPEDVAQSVFRSLFRGIEEQRFTLDSEDEVWRLLRHIALWKVRNRVRFYDADKRRLDMEETASAVFHALQSPSNESALEFYDLIDSVVRALRPPEQRTLELMISGMGANDIADELQVTTKSVQRYQKRIRDQLRGLLDGLQ